MFTDLSHRAGKICPIIFWNNGFNNRMRLWHSVSELKDKGKAHPLQALTGPEGSRRMKLPDFKTIDP
jgi:hypothetical protein